MITPKAMDLAIEKAKAVGVGMVTIGNARHLGMASYHAMLALKHDMIGICMTSCPPSVVPTFGAEAGWAPTPSPSPFLPKTSLPLSLTPLPAPWPGTRSTLPGALA